MGEVYRVEAIWKHEPARTSQQSQQFLGFYKEGVWTLRMFLERTGEESPEIIEAALYVQRYYQGEQGLSRADGAGGQRSSGTRG